MYVVAKDLLALPSERWSETQAGDYLTGVAAVFRLITDSPEMARVTDEFTPPVRIHPYRQHLIVHRVDDAGIDVIRILHNRSNWSDLLAEPGGDPPGLWTGRPAESCWARSPRHLGKSK